MKNAFHFLVTAMSIALLLQGCASMAVSSVNTQNMEGMDVDTVIKDMVNRGFQCGKKRSKKAVNSERITGNIGCSIADSSIACPVSNDVSINYDLATNKVTWAGKFQREHCF